MIKNLEKIFGKNLDFRFFYVFRLISLSHVACNPKPIRNSLLLSSKTFNSTQNELKKNCSKNSYTCSQKR